MITFAISCIGIYLCISYGYESAKSTTTYGQRTDRGGSKDVTLTKGTAE